MFFTDIKFTEYSLVKVNKILFNFECVKLINYNKNILFFLKYFVNRLN